MMVLLLGTGSGLIEKDLSRDEVRTVQYVGSTAFGV